MTKRNYDARREQSVLYNIERSRFGKKLIPLAPTQYNTIFIIYHSV